MKVVDVSTITRKEKPRLNYEALQAKIEEQNFTKTQALVFEERELHDILGTDRKSTAGKHMLSRVLSRKLGLRVLYDGANKTYIMVKF